MKELTEAEVKEFWQKCGFTQLEPGRGGYHFETTKKMWNWLPPNETERHKSIPFLPPIDLNNLGEYADPMLDKLGEHYIILQKQWDDYSIKEAEVVFVNINKYPDAFTGKAETYALALFWAIKKVFDERDSE